MKDLTTSEKAWKIGHWFLSWLNNRSFGSGLNVHIVASTLIFPLCANCSHSCTTINPFLLQCSIPSIHHVNTRGERKKNKSICTTLRLEYDPITCGNGHQSLLVWFYGLSPLKCKIPWECSLEYWALDRTQLLDCWENTSVGEKSLSYIWARTEN